MKTNTLKALTFVLAAPAIAIAAPASAAPAHSMATAVAAHQAPAYGTAIPGAEIYEHGRKHRKYKRGRGHGHANGHYDRGYRTYGEPIYRDTRIWRGRDGRYYCRKENGTTGLLIGAAVGGLIGNEVAGRGDRTLGAIIGAAGGAILGRAIDRSNSRCR